MLFSFLFTLLHVFSCSESKDDEQLRYLALGDSYTIGESVTVDERWPVQLTERLRSDGVNIADPQIIATTGWTTDELQEALDEEDLETEFDMVSNIWNALVNLLSNSDHHMIGFFSPV